MEIIKKQERRSQCQCAKTILNVYSRIRNDLQKGIHYWVFLDPKKEVHNLEDQKCYLNWFSRYLHELII